MKRFIKFLLIFTLPVVISGITIEVLLRHIPNDYRSKCNYLEKNSNNVTTLILGSSHDYYGINPQFFHSKSFNAAEVSQSVDYDYFILKKYDNNWKSLKTIVLSVDYPSLFSLMKDGSEAWRVKNYNIYYGLNTDNNIADYTEVFSNNLSINISRLYQYYLQRENLACSELGWATWYSSKHNRDLVSTGKTSAARHTIKPIRVLRDNVGYIKSIIDFAKARNIKVILFTAPAYKTYTENLNPAQLNVTVNALTKISRSYDNVSYFNLLNDPVFTKGDFYDADHLNEIGAKKLSTKIDSLITNPSQRQSAIPETRVKM